MAGGFTILHISDLHRSPSDPITNDELISALIGDLARYTNEDPKLNAPDAIVVSGDIIQGVPLETLNFAEELNKQYKIAETFLNELVNRFLAGDKSRIIIIPGNHDVDWNTAYRAMRRLNLTDLPKDFASRLFSDTSHYRWDWKNYAAFEIFDHELYALRLGAFWSFFEKFYKGTSGLLKVVSPSDVNLFSLFGGRIGVAAFNSCDGNDCFAFHGLVKKEVIARSHLELKDLGIFDLLIAVWHHNIEGPPYRTDYMDADIVRGMIGRGFRVGLYGHQHKAQVTPHQIWLPDQERMAMISAGSLCAGARDLPRGTHRQYNILELAPDLKSIKVHVREMSTANLFSRGRFSDLGGRSFVELSWEPPVNSGGGSINGEALRFREIVGNAEAKFKTGQHKEAFELLSGLSLAPGTYERKLYLQCAFATEEWQAIQEITSPPTTIEELIQRFEAFSRLKDVKGAKKAISDFSGGLNLPSSIKDDLLRKLPPTD